MGRAKLPIKLISQEKSRKVTFSKRRQGLKKKTLEFATLCGVDACFICFGPSGNHPSEPETWPENREEVNRIIKRYKDLPKEDREKRKLDLSTFLADKMKKLEVELAMTRRENAEALYPTWDERLNDLSEESLRELASSLDAKLETVRKRVEALKGKQITQGNELGISVQPVPLIHFSTSDFKPIPLSYRKPMDFHPMAVDYPNNPMVYDYGVGSYGDGICEMFQEDLYVKEIGQSYHQKEVWDFGHFNNGGYQTGGGYLPHVQTSQMYMPHPLLQIMPSQHQSADEFFNFQDFELGKYGRERL